MRIDNKLFGMADDDGDERQHTAHSQQQNSNRSPVPSAEQGLPSELAGAPQRRRAQLRTGGIHEPQRSGDAPLTSHKATLPQLVSGMQVDPCTRATNAIREQLSELARGENIEPSGIPDNFFRRLSSNRSDSSATYIVENASLLADIGESLMLLHRHGIAPGSFSSMFEQAFTLAGIERLRRMGPIRKQMEGLLQRCWNDEAFSPTVFRHLASMLSGKGLPPMDRLDALRAWCTNVDGHWDLGLLKPIARLHSRRGLPEQAGLDRLTVHFSQSGKWDYAQLDKFSKAHQKAGIPGEAGIAEWVSGRISPHRLAYLQATELIRARLDLLSASEGISAPEVGDNFVDLIAGSNSMSGAKMLSADADLINDIAATLMLLYRHGIEPSSFSSMFERFFTHAWLRRRAPDFDIYARMGQFLTYCKIDGSVSKRVFRSFSSMQSGRGLPEMSDVDVVAQYCTDEQSHWNIQVLSSIASVYSRKGTPDRRALEVIKNRFHDGRDWDEKALASFAHVYSAKGLPDESELAAFDDISNRIDRLLQSPPSDMTGETRNDGRYRYSSGQIRFASEAVRETAIIGKNVSLIFAAGRPASLRALGWCRLRGSLSNARAVETELIRQINEAEHAGRPLIPSIDGVIYQVAIDPSGNLADWFIGRFPGRLLDFTGRIAGYHSDIGLKRVRISKWEFSVTQNDGSVHDVEIRLECGQPTMLGLSGKGGHNTVSAVSRAWTTDVHHHAGIEPVDSNPGPEELALQQVVATSVRETLCQKYSPEEVDLIVRILAEWYDLQTTDGKSDEQAYDAIEALFDIPPTKLKRYMTAVSELLRRAGIGVNGPDDD
ncbi:hypothetical protein LJR230_002224 [Trinickia sp. LjRoot230]|uniref:hypothetical protein n=1 Tax=Trinickia sp. LjRoot230 TaxID=3342288 RepID=UPI003ECF27D4